MTDSPDSFANILIEIRNDGVWINAWKCGDKAPAIADYVRKKTPWYPWMPENLGAWAAIGNGLGVFVAGLSIGMSIFSPRLAPIQLFIFTAVSLIGVYLTFPARRVRLGATKIMLSRESNRRTFWERNGEKILVDLCKYGISGAIGFVAGRLWSGWFHE